jgi:hypothetical protein
MTIKGSPAARTPIVAALLFACVGARSASAESVITAGPRTIQTLVSEQLFNQAGRWYLIDDGDCHTYLDSPRIRIAIDRLVLQAHLSSRFGRQMGSGCVGAEFASNVTLSGKLRGNGHFLILDDIRIDRVDDESARIALGIALQAEPDLIPRTANIDVSEFVRSDARSAGGSSARIDEFRILNIRTGPATVVIQFSVMMSAP